VNKGNVVFGMVFRSLHLGDCAVVLHDHAEVGKERYFGHVHAGLARELQCHLDVGVVAWPSMKRHDLFLRCLVEVQEGLVALRECLTRASWVWGSDWFRKARESRAERDGEMEMEMEMERWRDGKIDRERERAEQGEIER
jgi:hypothetical protein